MWPADFHFLRPAWLWALLPLAALLWQLSRRSRADTPWRRVCDPHLLEYLLSAGGRRPRNALVLIGAGWLFAVLALAGPTWSRLPQPVYKPQSARVLVLDLSLSMNAADVRPSRAAQARYKLLDLLKLSREGQAALVVYAQDAYVVSPLSNDADTITELVPALAPELMPLQGGRVDRALARAEGLLENAGVRGGDIVLISDGGNIDAVALELAQGLRSRGRRLHTLGVGTTRGVPIPSAAGGFVKDADGAIVISRLEQAALQGLAQAGGGHYHALTAEARDLEALLNPTPDSKRAPGQGESGARTTDIWREQGPWLLLLLLPLAALGFRRGWLLSAVLLVSPFPQPAYAFDWDALWKRPDQRGAEALGADRPSEAARLFNDPAWRGTAHYRALDYPLAAEAFKQLQGADAAYNRGNALARLGDLQAAVETYSEALSINPGHVDARHNRAVVERLLQAEQREQEKRQGEDAARGNHPETGTEPRPSRDGDNNRQGRDQRAGGDTSASGGDDSPDARRGQPDAGSTREPDEDTEPAGDDLARAQPPQTSPQSTSSRTPNPAEAGSEHQGPDLEDAEARQAMEQWLRRIPDDPGGLLRRKFLLEHRRRYAEREESHQPW